MLTRDKSFYRSFLKLTVTLMLEQAVILSVNLADNVMLGNYSETSLAGVAAVNQIQFVLQQMVYSVGSIMIVLGSQYWGKGAKEVVPRLSSIAMRLALGVSAVMFVIMSLMPYGVLSLFTDDAAIAEEGVRYLRIMRFSYFPFAITAIFLNTVRIAEKVKIALQVSVVALVLNCGINFLLIAGRLGAPELGVQGAAVGTLTARCVECVLVALYVFKKDPHIGMKLRDYLHFDTTLVKDFLKVGIPMFITAFLWGANNAIQTMILGHLEDGAMAAYSISSTIFLLLKAAAVGACSAGSIIVGKAIGAGDMDKVKSYTRTLQLLFIGIGILLGISLFAIRMPLLSFYNVSETTRAMAETFILIQCVIICTMSYQMPVNAGIIRGGGDTRYTMILDLVSIWGIVIPLSLLAAFVWELSPVVVVIFLNADQVFKCIPAAIYVNTWRWIKKLTRDT